MIAEEKKQFTIKSARLYRGLTQEALAQRLGVSEKALGDWENNRVPVKPLYIYAIAYALKMDADEIRA